MFTEQKWNILQCLSKDKFSPIQLAEKLNTTMANISQQLRLLEAANLVKKEKISLKECVFVGDHHNDVKISKEAGLGIAFDAKDEELRKVADRIIDKKDLREILKYI